MCACCVKSVKRQVDTVSHLYNRSNEVVLEPNVFTNCVFFKVEFVRFFRFVQSSELGRMNE